MDFDVTGSSWNKKNDTAAIFHIYYPDLLDEMVQIAKNLGDSIEAYVTVNREQTDLIGLIRQQLPEARILAVENRGRDILPFLEILEKILPLGYNLLLKIHSKKTLHRTDGTLWRKDVVEKLLGSPETVEKARAAFRDDPRLGMLGAKGHVLNSQFYMGGNEALVRDLATRVGLDYDEPLTFPFVASTMFWARPEIFKPIIDAQISPAEFPEEPLPPDGTLAHAMERFFGLLAQEQSYAIKAIDADGSISDADYFAVYQYAPAPKALALRNVRKIVYYPAYQEAFAIEHLRITAPLRAAGVEVISGNPDGVADPGRVLLGDAVIFQREFPRNVVLYDQIVTQAQKHHKLIFYELDDLLFDLPETHPEREQEAYNSALLPMMTAMTHADAVIVPTDELRKVVEGFNPNVIVLPNYLDDTIWELQPPMQTEEDRQVTIGYMGSDSHTPDLVMIAPVLQELLSKYKGKLKLDVWGTPLPAALKELENVSWHPAPTNVYTDFVKYFQTLKFDLVIAPLADNLFNRCKSGLKFLEYSAIGAAGVYSRLAPYETIVSDGVDGFLASGATEWRDKLVRFIENPELRRRFAHSAQEKISKDWLLSKNIQSWDDIVRKLNREFLLESPNNILRRHIANTVNLQLFYDRRNLTGRLENLSADSEKLSEHIAILENQVHDLTRDVGDKNKKARKLFYDGINKAASLEELTAQVREISQENEELLYQLDDLNEQLGQKTEEHKQMAAKLERSEQTLSQIYNNPIWKTIDTYHRGRNKLSRATRKFRTLPGPLGRVFPAKGNQYKQLLPTSGLFDVDYYLRNNPDVRNAGVDPLLHFLNFGGMEGRNPSDRFDSNWYLDHNPDVRAAGMNPLVHYLVHGKREGRAIQSVNASREQAVASQRTSSEPKLVPDKIMLTADLVELFKVLPTTFEITLSHDDYVNVTGGAQVRISDEQRQVNRQGAGYLHAYPYRKLKTLAKDGDVLYLGLNLDGKPLGVTESGELIEGLKGLKDKHQSKVSIHHSMGFNLQTIQALLDLAGNKGVFWLHDYFTLCPSYNLRRNDREYCGAPDITSNSCQLCSYLEQRKVQQPLFKELFEVNQLEVAAPSQFTYDLWQSRFPVKVPGHIIPPAVLEWHAPGLSSYQSGVLRVGFLGYPLDYKGWNVWMKLVEKAADDQRYRFYQFSTQPGPKGNYQHIETRVTKEDRMAMVEALRANRIDVVVLWSTVAETFSFTLHEALAAGCFILTNPNSGNIQDVIRHNPERGLVLADEEALEKLFEDGAIIQHVVDYQKHGKPRATLVFGSLREINK